MEFTITEPVSGRIHVATASSTEKRFNYSRAIQVGDFIFVSNTSGTDYEQGTISSDPAEQTLQMVRNIEGALKAVGGELEDIVSATIHIPDRADLHVIGDILSEHLNVGRPTITVTCTPLADLTLKVEAQVIAAKTSR